MVVLAKPQLQKKKKLSKLLNYAPSNLTSSIFITTKCVNAKLLEANPEYLTAWNYRKFAVEHILSHSETDTEIDPDSIKSIYSEELRVTESALAKNYRSYGARYHRKWVLSKGHSSVDRELQLLGVFLKKDSRNFHAWNYRRFVAALKIRSDEEELHFTTDLINENFSNYSSCHNCSCNSVSFTGEKGSRIFLKGESSYLVHQALFTDPDDQSGWFYHLLLLEQTVKVENPLLVSTWPPHGSNLNVSADGFLDTCASSPVTVEDLIWSPLSTNNSGSSQAWGIVSLSGFHHSHPTHSEFIVLIQPHGSQHAEMKSAEMISWGDENFHTVSFAASKQLYCLSNVLVFSPAGYCSKIGKLMLARLLTAHDAMMSYDKTPETCKMVHSEELLSCLNLSNNKMGSFSALEPLTLLKSLKVLDISYNEIGAHVVDTRSYTKEALAVNAKLLEANPEYLTAWNYRKFAVEHILSHSETDTEIDPDSIKSIYSEELRVTESALAKNYRSYGARYHRKWVLSKGQSSVDRELQLLGVFLKKDSRNFHAWNYRRFVAALKIRSDEEELHFTTDLINENFSNYSSWHNCSVILSHLLEKRAQGSFSKEKVLTEEYDFVHQALFTDPDDQSGWLYHLWLLEQTVKVENPLLVSTWPPHGSNLNLK
ncbi:unnamed protein product [Camellia sinensis]